MIAQEDVISFPSTVCDLDLTTVKSKDLEEIKHSFNLKSMGSRELNSIVLWFDVCFPDGSVLSTSPDMEDTHWQNTVLPLTMSRVKQDDDIEGDLKITQDNSNYRFINVELNYSINKKSHTKRIFKMDDNCSES